MRKSAPILLLAFIALFSIWPLLRVGYTANLGSLEPATLVLARRVAEQGIWGWEPRWYLGFPFRFAGPPVSWWILGAIEKLGFFDLLVVYRVVKALALVALPITFYFLTKKVFSEQETRNQKLETINKKRETSSSIKVSSFKFQVSSLVAFVSSIFLIILPSIGYLFPKYWQVGAKFGFAPAWMQQEFSRSLGLAILPLVLIFYWRLLEKVNYSRLVVTIFATAVLFLTDGVTSLSLLVGITAVVIIETHKGQTARKVTAVGLVLALAFLIDAFFFTVQNIRLIAASPSISGIGLISFMKVMVQAAVGLGPAILVVASMKLLSKGRQSLAFIWLWLLPFITITLLFYFSNRDFLTEYTRFLPEIEMGIALLIGYWVGQKVLSIKYQVLSIKSLWSVVVLGTILITVVYSLYKTPARWRIFQPNSDITTSVEYQIAKWLERETVNCQLSPVRQAQGDPEYIEGSTVNCPRVFLSGSTAFWLNEFAPSVWQVRGGIDQASTNPFWARAVYQIRYSPDVETSLLWFKALRVGYLVVHEQNSSEYYHDFIYPEKFEGVCLGVAGPVTRFPPASAPQPFSSIGDSISISDSKKGGVRAVGSPSTGATRSECELVFDNGRGDRIYRVDSPIVSVAGLVGLKSLLLPDPAKKNERQALDVYADWLQAGKSAKLEETGDKLLVKADIGKDEVLALGITYDGGWRAKDSQGAKLKTARDPLGNLVIFPKQEGEQTITLKFQEGMDLWFGIAVSMAALFFIKFILPKKLPVILEKAQMGWEEEE